MKKINKIRIFLKLTTYLRLMQDQVGKHDSHL